MDTSDDTLRTRLAWLTVVVVWAGIYLPALGTLEIKGEEGRRALPGLEMLETGNWLVPQVGGEDYFRKPPLVNWAAAASVELTGSVAEWSVRLPSVIAVLVVALGVLWTGKPWLGLAGALLAALFALTNIGMMEKGRLIEIEALYICLYGLAVACWLGQWQAGRPQRGWMLAGVFLGLALLAKGPPHMLYFYAVVSGVVYGTREGGWRTVVREILRPGALLAPGIALGLFALWAVPMLQATGGDTTAASHAGAAGTWGHQLAVRLGLEGFHFWKWWENLFRSAIINFLPWSALFPLVWHRPLVQRMKPARARLFAGLRSGVLFGWLVVAVLPGSHPRYTLPLLVPASILVAMALVEWGHHAEPVWLLRAWRLALYPLLVLAGLCGLTIPFYAGFSILNVLVAVGIAFGSAVGIVLARRLSTAVSLALVSALLMVCLTGVYATAIAPRMAAHDSLKTMAAEVAASLPDGTTAAFFRPEYQPILFYLPRPTRIVLSTDDLRDTSITHLLVREKHLAQVRRSRGWTNSPTLTEIRDLDDKPLYLIKRMPEDKPN